MKKIIALVTCSTLILSSLPGNIVVSAEDDINPNLNISVKNTSIGQPYIQIDANDNSGGSGIRKVEINEGTPDEVTYRNSTSEKEMHTVYFPPKSGEYVIKAYDKLNNKTEKVISVNVDDSYTLPTIDVYKNDYNPGTKKVVIKVNAWKETSGKNLAKVINPDGSEVLPTDPSRPYSIKYLYEADNDKSYDFIVEDVNGYINLDRVSINVDVHSPNLKVSISDSEMTPGETVLEIDAWDNDHESGIQRVEITGGPTFEIENTDQYSINTEYKPPSGGEYTVTAFDREGNYTVKTIRFPDTNIVFPEIKAKHLGLESISVTAKSLNGNPLKEIKLPNGKYIGIENNCFEKTIIYDVGSYKDLEFTVIDSEDISASTTITPIDISQIEALVSKAEQSKLVDDIDNARTAVNNLPESAIKDAFQDRLNSISTPETLLPLTATGNVDIYIKSENMLSLSLDTNSVSFDNFSGVEDMEKKNAVSLRISSSLPYEVNAYLATEIENNDKTKTMDKSILNIKANSESTYKTFNDTVSPIVLLDNQIKGNDITHGIDLKLKGNIAHEKDVYKTTIKFEIKQK